jgi:hypothetical protein
METAARRRLLLSSLPFGEAIPCKDAVFTVGDKPELFVATICRDKSDRWRWAIAEPTVQRWGALQ